MSSPSRSAAPRFQSFIDTANPAAIAPRIAKLRKVMRDADLDGYLVPRGDMFRGEYVPANAERLAWLTGFTGSAGIAFIGRKRAALFVDGRYTLQAPAQTDINLFDVVEIAQAGMPEALATYVGGKDVIGYDPWLFAPAEIEALTRILGSADRLQPTGNLVDTIWTQNRPSAPATPIELLGPNRTGKSSIDKLTDLRQTLQEAAADAVVLTLPESVDWLLNIRGRDVPHVPFALAFAIVPRTGKPTLFIDSQKVGPEAKALREICAIAPIAKLPEKLEKLGAKARVVWIDPATSPAILVETLKSAGATLIEKRDPVLGPKSRKNPAEISGMREAHRRDGVAMAKFLRWLDAEAPKGGLTEIDIATRLEDFRREDETLVDISFDTISGAGPHGAIIHYRVTEATNRRLTPGEILLVDSGGQYLTGTTDITRTIATGPVSAEQKDRYTRVLKGMIGISMARFPIGTTGAQIDILARQHLWQVGLNYGHGTGHGVGAFLSVHEGPVGIAPRYSAPLELGNILSNEPGFYLKDAYGIRIENLIQIVAARFDNYLEFETLTLAPIDTRLIAIDLLTATEREWLNAYHARVFSEIGPELDSVCKAWLARATVAL